MSNYKPAPRRHIGPAMQWAKPRTDNVSSTGRRSREIKIQFPDVADDSDSTVFEVNDRDTSHNTSGRAARSSSDPGASRTTEHRSGPSNNGSADPWWRRVSGLSSEEGSAWSEYSTSVPSSAQPRFPESERRFDASPTTYNYGSDDYETSFSENPPGETAQHNASSFDIAQPSPSEGDRSGWLLYLLPVAVVALVVFLAFLTLMT